MTTMLWRDNTSEDLKTFELVTVTYGTTLASFLAIRTLQQLAKEEANNFLIGSKIALRDFYIDDLITGVNTIEEAQLIQTEISAILSNGGFELQKWCSNNLQILNIPANVEYVTVNLDKNQDISTCNAMGRPSRSFKIISPRVITTIQGNQTDDYFQYCSDIRSSWIN